MTPPNRIEVLSREEPIALITRLADEVEKLWNTNDKGRRQARRPPEALSPSESMSGLSKLRPRRNSGRGVEPAERRRVIRAIAAGRSALRVTDEAVNFDARPAFDFRDDQGMSPIRAMASAA